MASARQVVIRGRRLAWLFVAALAWPALVRAGVTDIGITPEDGVINSDPTESEGSLTIRYIADEAGTLRLDCEEFRSDSNTRAYEHNGGATEATIALPANLFNPLDRSFDLDVSFSPADSSESTSPETVATFELLVDGVYPSVPGSQSVIPSNGSLIVGWDISAYDSAASKPTNARTNVESFRLIYSTTPLSDVVAYVVEEDSSVADLDNVQPDAVQIETVDFTDNHVVTGLDNDVTYYLAVEAVDHAGNRSGLRIDGNGNIVAAAATPVVTRGFGEAAGIDDRCFVATAAFGDVRSPWVDAYRFFRDRFLAKLPGGEWLIAGYYRYGAHAARVLDASPDLRVAVRLLLLAVAPVALLLGGVGPLGLLLVAGLWLGRRRARLALLPLLLAVAVPAPASADDWQFEHSLSLFTRRYSPDDAGAGNAISYADVYGDYGTYLIEGDYTWYPLTKGGKLGVGGRFGFGRDVGNAVIASTGASSAETTKIWLLPASLLLRYRGEYVKNQPVVPSVNVGFDGWGLHEKRRSQGDGIQNFVLGWHAGAELELSLNWIEPDAALRMEQNYGIANTIFYGGYEYVSLDDFGSVKTADFSDHNWTAGIRFIF